MKRSKWLFTFGAGLAVGGTWMLVWGGDWSAARIVGLVFSSSVVVTLGWLRREHLHWQAVQTQRMTNTLTVINEYLSDVRPLILAFTQAFLERFGQETTTAKTSYALRTEREYFHNRFSREFDLAGILHHLDKIGMVLQRRNYVFNELVLAAITSEVARLLLEPRFSEMISSLLRTSTLKHVEYLQKEMERYRDGKHTRLFKRSPISGNSRTY